MHYLQNIFSPCLTGADEGDTGRKIEIVLIKI